jgi:nitrate/TMAO reductase-like tetraheme cytochrome c subunit
MSTKTKRLISIFSVFVFLFLVAGLILPVGAFAAPSRDPISNSCLSCHEDLYYLHDSGKYYCITEHKDRCVNCHEGNTSVMKKDESHVGLIAHPQKGDGAKCQQCHPNDTQARLATFASLGGYKPVMEAVSYTPSKTIEAGFPETTESNTFSENLPVMVLGIILFGLWLVLVFFSPQKP